MFRSITALLLIFTLITANFSRYFIYAGFELNKKYIASALCENKDKPVLKCKGKCYLAKKIKQDEEKEKSQDQQSKKSQFQEALITQKLRLNYPSNFKVTALCIEKPFDLPQHSFSIFHPPQV